MSVQTRSGGRAPTAHLNITPLVDIALVLLVIFLIATPLAMRSLPVDIPAPAEGAVPAELPIIVSVGPTGRIELTVERSVEQIEAGELRDRLAAIGPDRLRRQSVFVDFHPELPYGDAVSVADTIRSLGVERVNLSTRGQAGPSD